MTGTTRQRGEYAKTAQRREQILDAAIVVFSKVGMLNGSLTEIAKRVDMTLPGLTHHFPTKTALLEGIVGRRDLDAYKHLEGRRGVELFRGLLEIAERDQADVDVTRMFAILAAEATDSAHPANDFFRQRYDVIVTSVQRGFAEAEVDGHLRPGIDPLDAARTYIAVSDGLQLQALYRPDTFSQSTLTRELLEGILSVPLTGP